MFEFLKKLPDNSLIYEVKDVPKFGLMVFSTSKKDRYWVLEENKVLRHFTEAGKTDHPPLHFEDTEKFLLVDVKNKEDWILYVRGSNGIWITKGAGEKGTLSESCCIKLIPFMGNRQRECCSVF